MPIINKTKRTAAIYNRGREVVKVYDHGKLAWQKQTAIPDYLCFTALDDNTQFTFTKYINLLNTNLPSISYSMDGGDTWTEVAMSGSGNEDIVTTPAVNAGGKVLWKAEAARFALAPDKYSTFTANGRFNVSGNIMSLLYGDNHYDKTDTRAYTYTFGSLFRDSTNLIDASQLKLPTGHLNAADLLGLFRGCTGLVHGAPLYAPNIPDSCCYWMYYGCTSMTEMPTIAATSMIKDNGDPANYGLYYAFYGCSNMEGEVKLNIVGEVAQQVLDACFSNCSKITSADLAFNGALGKMALRGAFVGCTSLSHVKCLATSFYDDGTAANGSLYNWMNNVSSTGVFVQAEGMQWPQGKSGIPTGWLAYDEGEDIPNDYEQLDYAGNDSGRAWVNVGAVTTVYEAWQVTFRTPVIGTQAICGYYGADTTTTPKQASQSYLYARSSPDSFQHQHFRVNGDSYSSQNGLLKDIRDTEWHTFKVWFKDGLRRIEFDGVDKGMSTREYATMKENLNMYLFNWQGTNGDANIHISEFIRYEEDAETETMHLLPCKRKSDDVVGYWDTIGLQFRTSGNAHALIGGYLTNNDNE